VQGLGRSAGTGCLWARATTASLLRSENDRELDLAALDVKDRVRNVTLAENNLALLIFRYCFSIAYQGEKYFWIECCSRALPYEIPQPLQIRNKLRRRVSFYDQLGRMYTSTASQHLHTKPAANQDSGTVSGSESTLRTVSRAHVLQEAKSERASSHRTSPSVAGGPGGCSGLIHSPRAQCPAVPPSRSRRLVGVAFPCDRHSG
jgi:hypothetical protein